MHPFQSNIHQYTAIVTVHTSGGDGFLVGAANFVDVSDQKHKGGIS